MGYGISHFMGYGLEIPAYQVGGPKKPWGIRGYGLYPLWVKRGLTVFVQMFVWLTYAPPVKLCLYFSPKPTEHRQLRQFPAYRVQTVRLLLIHQDIVANAVRRVLSRQLSKLVKLALDEINFSRTSMPCRRDTSGPSCHAPQCARH
jgi:hypothetical protein